MSHFVVTFVENKVICVQVKTFTLRHTEIKCYRINDSVLYYIKISNIQIYTDI